MQDEAEILVVGAGPTGMSAALALHDFGYQVLIIDQHETGLDFSRAILVNSNTLRLLKPFGIAEKIIRRGIPFQSLAIRGPGGSLIEGAVGSVDADGIRPIALPQLMTEQCLLEGLLERQIKVERPTRLIEVQQDADQVLARVETEGRERIIRCAYLLGADGSHSVVREQLGIAYHRSPRPLKMYSQDAILPWEDQPDLAIWILDSGAAIAMKIAEDRVRFAATDKATFETLGFVSRIRETTWESEFDVFFAQVDRYGSGRVWIAGDAAHVHSPIGGRGMNMGIADGIRFAEALKANDLKGYAADRHAVSGPWVRKNQRLTEWISDRSPKGALVRPFMRAGFRMLSALYKEQAARKIFAAVALG